MQSNRFLQMNNRIFFKLKTLFLITIIFCIAILLSACDKTLLDIHTQLNSDYSGVRTVDIAVKTEYLKKGEVAFSGEKPLFDRIIEILPQGEINTSEKDAYTHFTSKITFKDINFLPHISIDNFSENPPDRFYAKIEKKDSLFSTEYFFSDFIDMEIDDAIIKSGGVNSDYSRLDNLLKSDEEIVGITYQTKFPFKITKSNADVIGNNNIAIWNIGYGQQKLISAEGKKIKFLPYFLLVILGIIIIFILFLIFAIAFAASKRKITDKKSKPIYSYDNYFKKDKKDKY